MAKTVRELAETVTESVKPRRRNSLADQRSAFPREPTDEMIRAMIAEANRPQITMAGNARIPSRGVSWLRRSAGRSGVSTAEFQTALRVRMIARTVAGLSCGFLYSSGVLLLFGDWRQRRCPAIRGEGGPPTDQRFFGAARRRLRVTRTCLLFLDFWNFFDVHERSLKSFEPDFGGVRNFRN